MNFPTYEELKNDMVSISPVPREDTLLDAWKRDAENKPAVLTRIKGGLYQRSYLAGQPSREE